MIVHLPLLACDADLAFFRWYGFATDQACVQADSGHGFGFALERIGYSDILFQADDFFWAGLLTKPTVVAQ